MKLRTSLAAAATASVLALTACGSAESGTDDGDDGDGGDTTTTTELTADTFATAVSDAQIDAGTVSMEMAMSVEAQGTEIELDAEGQVETADDPLDNAMSMTMTMSGDEPMIAAFGNIEMVLVDRKAYLKMALTGDKWVVSDVDDPNSPFASIGEQGDPTQMVSMLEGAVDSFEATDETTEIDGVEATKYDLVVDGEALSELGAGDLTGSTGSSDTEAMPDTLPMELWIDDDNLLRRMSFSLDAGGGSAEIEATFTGYGEPVDIEAPPADEVTDENPFGGLS